MSSRDEPEPETLKEIVDSLWDQILKLRRGETTPAKANAVTRVAGEGTARARAWLRAARVGRSAAAFDQDPGQVRGLDRDRDEGGG
jgi:hypothetical protein